MPDAGTSRASSPLTCGSSSRSRAALTRLGLDAVLGRPASQVPQPGHLRLGRGDDELAGGLERYAVGAAEVLGRLLARAAQLRLERARGVVDARVDHAGVVAALVRGEAVLLLQHHHRGVRAPLEQGQGGGQPDDAAADDGVLTVHAAAPLPPSVAWGPSVAGLAGACPQQPAQRLQPRDAGGAGLTGGDPGVEARTPPRRGCSRGGTGGPGLEVGEVVDDPVEVDVGEAERAHAGGVDDPALRRPGRRSATAEVEVCRPRPVTSLTTPIARWASGTSPLTRVDLPTPEWPTKTLTRPSRLLVQRFEPVEPGRPRSTVTT